MFLPVRRPRRTSHTAQGPRLRGRPELAQQYRRCKVRPVCPRRGRLGPVVGLRDRHRLRWCRRRLRGHRHLVAPPTGQACRPLQHLGPSEMAAVDDSASRSGLLDLRRSPHAPPHEPLRPTGVFLDRSSETSAWHKAAVSCRKLDRHTHCIKFRPRCDKNMKELSCT